MTDELYVIAESHYGDPWTLDAVGYTKLDESLTMQREWGKTPNGNMFGGSWVLRGPDGQYIDHDAYRSDLTERNQLELVQAL
jgi:hypothetical protein